MDNLSLLNKEREIFFKYMHAKYPVYYNSNIFLRDLQYAVRRFFETKSKNLSYTQAEKIALEFAKILEDEGDLFRLDANSWRVNFHIGETAHKLNPEPVEEAV